MGQNGGPRQLKVKAVTQLQLTDDNAFVGGLEQAQNCFLKEVWDCTITAVKFILLGDDFDDF